MKLDSQRRPKSWMLHFCRRGREWDIGRKAGRSVIPQFYCLPVAINAVLHTHKTSIKQSPMRNRKKAKFAIEEVTVQKNDHRVVGVVGEEGYKRFHPEKRTTRSAGHRPPARNQIVYLKYGERSPISSSCSGVILVAFPD